MIKTFKEYQKEAISLVGHIIMMIIIMNHNGMK
jgi:hypothetical protein